MYEDAANANGIGSMQNSFGTVAEKGAAEASAFMALVDGQPSKDDDRNWIRHVAAEAAGCFRWFDST